MIQSHELKPIQGNSYPMHLPGSSRPNRLSRSQLPGRSGSLFLWIGLKQRGLRRRLAIVLFVVVGVVSLADRATPATGETIPPVTVTLSPSQDNTLYQTNDGAVSNGAGAYLFAGVTNDGFKRRAVLAFDVAAAVPEGATILDAEVVLFMSKSPVPSGAFQFGLHRLTDGWGEGTSDAGSNGGGGAPATTGDATWIHTFYDTSTWTKPGGEFQSSAGSTALVGELVQAYTWPSTSALVADVQYWLEHPLDNFGWILVGDEESSRTAKRFNARENNDAESRPQLVIEYRPPATVEYVYLPTIYAPK